MRTHLATDETRMKHGLFRGLCSSCVQSVAAFLVLLFAGCAVNRPQFAEREFDPLTGLIVKERTLTVPTVSLWPASVTMDKQRISLGKTFSVGTEGAELETSSTNAAATLRELRLLIESLR